MNTKILIVLIALFSVCFSSCSKEDEYEKLENETHNVLFKVYADNPDEEISLPGYQGQNLSFKDYFEDETTTKSFWTGIVSQCSN